MLARRSLFPARCYGILARPSLFVRARMVAPARIRRKFLRAGPSLASTDADDPHLLPLVVDCEKHQVGTDDELTHFVIDVRLFFRHVCTSWYPLERIDRVPQKLEPTIGVLRFLHVDRDVARLSTNRSESSVCDLDGILDHRSSERPNSSAILPSADLATCVRPFAMSSLLFSSCVRLSASSALSASAS